MSSKQPSKEVIRALVDIQRKLVRAGALSANLQRIHEKVVEHDAPFMVNLKHLQANLLIFDDLDVLMDALGIDKLFADAVNENNDSLQERIDLATLKKESQSDIEKPKKKKGQRTGFLGRVTYPWNFPAPL